MDTAHGTAAPALSRLSRDIREYSLFQAVLLVIERADEAGWLSARNLPQVHILEAGQLNTYDVLLSDDVIFTKAAFDRFVVGHLPSEGSQQDAEPEGSDA